MAANNPTPWGPARRSKEIAEGIVEHSTESHGGIVLSEERFAAMPECIKAVKPWAGPRSYEEDQDWALVVLAFPEHFDPRSCWCALKIARSATSRSNHDWLPPDLREPSWTLDLAAYLETETGQAFRAKADRYAAETAGLFEPGSWGTDGKTCRQWAKCEATGTEVVIAYPAGSRCYADGAFALADVPVLFPGATVKTLRGPEL
ncbi:MAG: hypothetical protein EOM91_21400 [Sphingobacteriia bacterium]|nr:hypothetical protein [Sphingobacteriia bacterium]